MVYIIYSYVWQKNLLHSKCDRNYPQCNLTFTYIQISHNSNLTSYLIIKNYQTS